VTDSATGETVSEHPTSEAMAAYLGGAMPQGERATLESHLAECRACRHEVTSARRVITRLDLRRRLWRAAPIAAAAAIALLVLVPRRDGGRANDLMRGPDSADASLGRELIGVLTPVNDATVAAGPVVFSWRRAAPRLLYRLTITEAGGAAVWTAETTDTTLTLPGDVRLAPAQTYFWLVDALGPDGRSLTTRTQRFSTPP